MKFKFKKLQEVTVPKYSVKGTSQIGTISIRRKMLGFNMYYVTPMNDWLLESQLEKI